MRTSRTKEQKTNFPGSVGVIISTYNHPDWLQKVLWGYSNQSFKDFEIIVADDGSLPATKQLLEQVKLELGLRIKHVWQPDLGFRKNSILNAAIQASESEYLIFTDQDCIPRKDFVETHLRNAKRNHYLSGGYFKIPFGISQRLTQKDVEEQRLFNLKWLFRQGIKWHFKCTKLFRSETFSKFMNSTTTAKATWNGCNASGWKTDLMRINGFNETLQYGGEDRELGVRLQNLNIKGLQVRYSAVCIHLDHERPYKDPAIVKSNKAFRKKVHRLKLAITPDGIHKDPSNRSLLPKKVFFLNSTRTWGGGEKWHLEHALFLSKTGDEVQMLTQKDSELQKRAIECDLKVNKFAITNLSFLSPIKMFKMFHFLRQEKPDILLMNFSNDLKIAGPVAKWAGIPRVIYRRGSAIPIRDTFLNRYLYGRCLTDLLANSEETKRTLLQNNPNLFPKEKIKVIYNGINTNGFLPPPKSNTIPIVGNLGRLVRQKRQDLLIQIAEILKNRGVNCRFRIGGDGELRNRLQQMITTKDLLDYVELVGAVADPNLFHSEVDVFALTSEWEGFGYVLAEAMLASKPVVAFQISSNPELIEEGVNGFLVEMNDLEAFADALQELIENVEMRKELGRNGYKRVCELFDFDKNVLKFREFIHN